MKILLVGDSSDSARLLVDQVNELGNEYEINFVPWSLYTSRITNETDLVLVNDYNNPDCEKLGQLRRSTKIPILLISMTEDDEALAQLYNAGINDHLVQPFSYPLLFAKLQVWKRWTICRVPKMLYC